MADPRVQTIRNQLYNRGAWTAWEALDSLARDASRVAALETALRRLEFSKPRELWTADRWHSWVECPGCGQERENGHEPDCWLAAALAGSGTEPQEPTT